MNCSGRVGLGRGSVAYLRVSCGKKEGVWGPVWFKFLIFLRINLKTSIQAPKNEQIQSTYANIPLPPKLPTALKILIKITAIVLKKMNRLHCNTNVISMSICLFACSVCWDSIKEISIKYVKCLLVPISPSPKTLYSS